MPRWQMNFIPRIQVRSPEIVGPIVEIEAFKRSVLKIPLPPRMREEIDRINIIRQIKGTTGIEGNTLSEEEIKNVLGATAEGKVADDIPLEQREAINAERVHQFIIQHAKANSDGVITEELIRTIHRMTTDGCNYSNNIEGEYRRYQVTVGDFLPPEHYEVSRLMSQFLELINSREVIEGLQAVIRAVIAHFYLITIHPFGDGNGRTSRALEAYILYQGGYNVRGFYSLANHFYRHRSTYIQKLQDARFRHDGNLTDFVIFALHGFVDELQRVQDDILMYVTRVLFRDVYLERLRQDAINGRGLSLLEHLTFVEPKGIEYDAFKNRSHYLSLGLYEGKSPKTLMRDIQNLQKLELVVVRDGLLQANLALMNQFA